MAKQKTCGDKVKFQRKRKGVGGGGKTANRNEELVKTQGNFV